MTSAQGPATLLQSRKRTVRNGHTLKTYAHTRECVLKTLVLGGYGNFGARISRALAHDPEVDLLIGGRDESRGAAFANELGPRARAVVVDWTAPGFADALRDLRVELLIHTAGPFQGQDYLVARAAASASAHYIDLADGRRFVCDFPAAVDALFRKVGRVGITGASSVPALSSAVVAHLTHGWQSIEHIASCIAPAQTAPRGAATIAAVLGYCGATVPVWTGSKWQGRRAWAHPSKVQFARMRPRLGALCDIPDLELFPAYFAVRDSVLFQAALEVGLAQRAFAAIAALRGAGLLPRPEQFAAPLHAAGKLFDGLGSSTGGMVVRVQGYDGARRHQQRAWHLTAPNDLGPEIPCMAAILLARRLIHGKALATGAHVCMGLLTLADFLPEFERWGMLVDQMDEGVSNGAPTL